MRRESLSEIINRMVVDFKGIRTPEAIEFAKKYFSKARADLKGAKVLHKKKVFDDSVFLLQQSVEKAAKGIYILYSKESKKKIRKIGHKDPFLFLEIFKTFSSKYLDALKFFDPNWEVSDFVNAFDKMMGSKLKLARMDKNGILKLVEIPRKALNANSDIGKKIKESWAKAGASEEIKKFDAGIDANRGDMPAKHLEQIYAFYSLLVLCFLTFPHVTSTRYYGELISPDEYKKGLGIVDAARVLFGEMEKLLPIVERQLES